MFVAKTFGCKKYDKDKKYEKLIYINSSNFQCDDCQTL